MRRRAKIDTTQPGIVLALRQVGASVVSIAAIGQGRPDLLVGFRGREYLLECKSPGGTLTDDECDFIQGWRGQVHVVGSVEQALAAIGAVAREPVWTKEMD